MSGNPAILNNNPNPTGSITMFGGNTAPTGWLLCDGSAISRSTYATLFSVISTTFGVGDNSTTFNVPDMRGIFPKGAGTTNRAAGKDANGNYYAGTLGTYLTDKMQGHSHDLSSSSVAGSDYVLNYTANRTKIASGTKPVVSTITDDTNGVPRTGLTTEPANLGLNYIIKI